MAQEPSLAFTFEIEALIGPPIDLGNTRMGHKRVIPILGGKVQGQGLKGRILAGGADWQVVFPDGGADLDARYTIEMDDKTLIQVSNRGMRRGDPDTLAKINRGEKADMSKIYFRTVATMETSMAKYLWLTDAIYVGVGEREPDRVRVKFYKVN
jgi:hypothetical protein